jgi:hypothetical protein
MKKAGVILLLLFQATYSFSQDVFDMRKTKWGMAIKEVKESETANLSEEHSFKAGTLELNYADIIVGNYLANVKYEFTNGVLTQIVYSIYNQSRTPVSFNQSMWATKSVIELLMKEKQMKLFHCWNGNTTMYKFEVCKLDDKGIQTMENSMKTGENKFFSYGINNSRTFASFTNDLPDGKWPGLVTVIYFTPAQKVGGSGF